MVRSVPEVAKYTKIHVTFYVLIPGKLWYLASLWAQRFQLNHLILFWHSVTQLPTWQSNFANQYAGGNCTYFIASYSVARGFVSRGLTSVFSEHSIQGVPRLEDITAGGDFLGRCDQKSSYKHVSDFGRLRSNDRLKLRIEGNDYWQ